MNSNFGRFMESGIMNDSMNLPKIECIADIYILL